MYTILKCKNLEMKSKAHEVKLLFWAKLGLCKPYQPSFTGSHISVFSCMMVAVHLSRQDALMDEKLCIKVSGLKPKQVVTVYAKTVEQGKRFASFAVYIANEQGEINLSTDPSLIGTYTGIARPCLYLTFVCNAACQAHLENIELFHKIIKTSWVKAS